MSFFKTVISLCSGVSVFLKLLSMPLWRMVLHTILMILTCSLIISTVTWFHDKARVTEVANRFFERTEGILLTEDQLTLPKDPELERHYILAPHFRFDYFAATDQIDLQCIESARETSGVICLPAGCVVWTRDEQ